MLAPLRHPDGPIVLVQVDNEGALYFRDGAYDQDYHPDAVQLFREFLREKYKRPSALRAAWETIAAPMKPVTFATAAPPERFDAKTQAELARHLDWAEFHEHLLATAFERMPKKIVELGLDGVPTMHNFPLGEAATPLNPQRLYGSIDLVGLDYYHHATPSEHMVLMRRTTELAARAEGRDVPAFGAEIGAGFPPFFAPLDEKDSLYTLMAALAYGLRGFNLYMAVERDRWIGAPIDPHGHPRPLADAYNELCEALERVGFYTLRAARAGASRRSASASAARARHARVRSGDARRVSHHGRRFSRGRVRRRSGDRSGGVVRARVRARALARGVPFAYAGGETLEDEHRGRVVDRVRDGRWVEGRCAHRASRARERRRARHARPCRADARRLVARARAARRRARPRDRTARRSRARRRAREQTDRGARAADVPHRSNGRVRHGARRRTGARAARLRDESDGAPIVAKIGVPGVETLVALLGDDATLVRAAGGFDVTIPARTVRIFEADPA